MSGTEERPLPPREWLEDLKDNNPDPDPDNSIYLGQHQTKHLGSHDHAFAVSKISSEVAAFYAASKPFRIYHGSTNSTRPANFRASHMVDTSHLNHILSVNREGMTCLVEPNVPMDALVDFLQPFGLVPPVVMEFPGITVGGGFAGTSGESSSFKYGFFDNTVASIEIVLGNGEVATASESERPDLFAGAAGSFGTLGVVTLLKLKLVKGSFWVELTYYPVTSTAQALHVIEEKNTDEKVDYLDGILYSKTSGVIITGRRHSEPSLGGKKVVRFTRDNDPWFYLHAEKVLKSSSKATEPYQDVTALKDYLFRYDRGAFWTGRYAFKYFLVPFTWFTRLILDYFMHTRVMYHALHKSGQSDLYIIQDLAIPWSRTEEFINWLNEEFGLYPLWLCPLKIDGERTSTFHPTATKRDLMINVGLWGPGPRNRTAFVAKNRELEKKVRQLGGMKWLYAHVYYTAEEFQSIYDHTDYDKLRSKYHAERLPNVYDKVHTPIEDRRSLRRKIVMAIWPLSGIYGVLMALLGGSYLVRGGRQERRSAITAAVVGLLIGLLVDIPWLFSVVREWTGI